MKLFFTLFTLLICECAFSQKDGDSKIVITLEDSIGAFLKTKEALIRNNFIVKDLSLRDTIYTYMTEFNGMFINVTATLNSNVVSLSGVYSLKKIDDFGYTNQSKAQSEIIYYKGSRTWLMMSVVAKMIGTNITYHK